ncbi:MAG: hypothetical protein ABH873_03090 [Candidatus Firestonebacteria bacterium]
MLKPRSVKGQGLTPVLLFVLSLTCIQAQQIQLPQPQTTSEKPFSKPSESGKLEDITITGEDKLKVKSEKPYLELKMDLNEIVLPTIETERKFLEKSPNLVNLQESVPKFLMTGGTANPYLIAMIKEPIANFSLNVLGIKVAAWELIVTDSKGKVFKKFEGKGVPPSSIEWSGRNQEDKVVKVGNAYSYLVNFTDEAGNPRTLIGAPFVIHSLIHQEENGLFISITRKKLFNVEKEKTKLIDENIVLLKESLDILKENFNLSIKVEVYGENSTMATEQSKVVAKYLTDSLILPEDRIKYIGYEDTIENYRIDMLIKNR